MKLKNSITKLENYGTTPHKYKRLSRIYSNMSQRQTKGIRSYKQKKICCKKK